MIIKGYGSLHNFRPFQIIACFRDRQHWDGLPLQFTYIAVTNSCDKNANQVTERTGSAKGIIMEFKECTVIIDVRILII